MQHSREISASPNLDVADRLDEVARIFAQQGANRFRVRAYRHAAGVLRGWPRSVADIFAEEGIEGLGEIPGIGPSIARSIRDILLHGRLAMLDRLRGESDPVAILASVPGIGKIFAAPAAKRNARNIIRRLQGPICAAPPSPPSRKT